MFRIEVSNTHSLERTLSPRRASHPNRVIRFVSLWQLTDFHQLAKLFTKLSSSRAMPFSTSTTGTLLDKPIASVVKSMLGCTHHTVHCNGFCNKIFGCLITVKSDFLGLRFNSVLRCRFTASMSKSAALSFHCICVKKLRLHRQVVAQLVLCALRNVLISSHLTTGTTKVVPYFVKNVSFQARSS